MKQSQKLAYDIKYTAGTYADLAMTLPIATSRGVCKLASKVSEMVGTNIPSILREESLQQSPVFRAREKLRESLDTEPGTKYIVSNLAAIPPFFLAGAPIAEGMHSLAEHILPNMNSATEYVVNAAGTITGQLAAGYSAFQLGDIIQNSSKYRHENGSLSLSKMAAGYWNTTKAFIKFDVPYIVGKIAGQSSLRAMGKDPGIASNLFDMAAIPVWYAIAVPIGIRYNLIDNKETRKRLEDTVKEKMAERYKTPAENKTE